MGMIGYAKAGGEKARVFRFLTATIGMLAFFPISAESADDLKPPVGYRRLFHVNTRIVDKSSPLFEVLGGMHNVHVNSVGESALRKGGPYPNGTVFLIDLHEFSVVDGSYVEGALKGLALMAKDSKKYASTGGWGFQFWAQGAPKKPIVTMPSNNASNVINQRRTRIMYIPRTFPDRVDIRQFGAGGAPRI